MKKVLLFLFCAMASVAISAQSVSGTVIDADNNEPLIGVSVLEVGTINGIVTDIDGNFELTVQEGAKLQLSYVGYETVVNCVHSAMAFCPMDVIVFGITIVAI